MRQHQSSGRLTPSLGLSMRLRIVAREHHTVADAARFWVRTAGKDQQR
jgi:hypothetical protein